MIGLDFLEPDLSRTIIAGRVDENHEVRPAYILCKLGHQLVRDAHLHVVALEPAGEKLGGAPADSIVAAQRVAPADDENPGHSVGLAPCLQEQSIISRG